MESFIICQKELRWTIPVIYVFLDNLLFIVVLIIDGAKVTFRESIKLGKEFQNKCQITRESICQIECQVERQIEC